MENSESPAPKPLDFEKLEHGCNHYRRRCKIRAPCCDQIFSCRHCHNEATSSLSNPKDRHEIVRQDVKQVVCSICNTEQEVAQVCTSCGVQMGEYFCNICKFFDDDTNKGQFHCNECGICRVGGRDNFFHCQKCGSCYGVDLRDNHLCVENSMKNHCPVCYEYLFDSVKGTSIMNCGHTMHTDCFIEMHSQNQYRCPLCSKTLVNMTRFWSMLDAELQLLPCLRSTCMRLLSSAMIASKHATYLFTFLGSSAPIAVHITPAEFQVVFHIDIRLVREVSEQRPVQFSFNAFDHDCVSSRIVPMFLLLLYASISKNYSYELSWFIHFIKSNHWFVVEATKILDRV